MRHRAKSANAVTTDKLMEDMRTVVEDAEELLPCVKVEVGRRRGIEFRV